MLSSNLLPLLLTNPPSATTCCVGYLNPQQPQWHSPETLLFPGPHFCCLTFHHSVHHRDISYFFPLAPLPHAASAAPCDPVSFISSHPTLRSLPTTPTSVSFSSCPTRHFSAFSTACYAWEKNLFITLPPSSH